jgi:phosphatidylserine/phosphatidylglycerophosphate/cardiolipin synthase-like enzyme
VIAARCSVWIATANLKELMVLDGARVGRQSYRSVLDVLDELAQRGVELRVLHAALPSRPFRESFDRHARLVKGGLELRLCPRVHFKAVIVDGGLLYLGSANWTGAGLGAKGSTRRNFELGLVTDDALLLDRVQSYFDSIWSGAACAGCGRRDVCEAPLDPA